MKYYTSKLPENIQYITDSFLYRSVDGQNFEKLSDNNRGWESFKFIINTNSLREIDEQCILQEAKKALGKDSYANIIINEMNKAIKEEFYKDVLTS